MSKTKTIELTKEQFFALLKTVYIGNWIANANTIPGSEKGDEYEQIESLIFSCAEKFGFRKHVDQQPDADKYYPTILFEEGTDVHKKIEDYEEESFWRELVDRLAQLHIVKDFGKQKLKKMTVEEYWELLDIYTEKYAIEFEERGLNNLLIDD